MTAYGIGQRIRTTVFVAGFTPATSLDIGTPGTITGFISQAAGGGYAVLVDSTITDTPLAYDHDEIEAADELDAPEGPR